MYLIRKEFSLLIKIKAPHKRKKPAALSGCGLIHSRRGGGDKTIIPSGIKSFRVIGPTVDIYQTYTAGRSRKPPDLSERVLPPQVGWPDACCCHYACTIPASSSIDEAVSSGELARCSVRED